jgi:hypothetical protein
MFDLANLDNYFDIIDKLTNDPFSYILVEQITMDSPQ